MDGWMDGETRAPGKLAFCSKRNPRSADSGLLTMATNGEKYKKK